MLGYVVAEGRGEADALVQAVADRLRAEQVNVAGAVQVNLEQDPERACHMDLHVLSSGAVIRISQDLGALSQGCRLDPDGLERAVGLVAKALEQGPDVLIVNKFGNQEADGRGFRPVIGEAMAAGIPVLVAVSPGSLEDFRDFVEDMGEKLPVDVETVLAWIHAQKQDGQDASLDISAG